MVLCDIEGLSYEEIAVTLGIKLGTVRSRIHRARAQLRDALEHRRAEVTRVAAPSARTVERSLEGADQEAMSGGTPGEPS